jgi:undecaprenyl-diphosphatase
MQVTLEIGSGVALPRGGGLAAMALHKTVPKLTVGPLSTLSRDSKWAASVTGAARQRTFPMSPMVGSGPPKVGYGLDCGRSHRSGQQSPRRDAEVKGCNDLRRKRLEPMAYAPPTSGPFTRCLRGAKRLEIGLLLAVIGVMGAIWAFLGLTGEVRENETTGFDDKVLLAFRVHNDLAQLAGPRWLQEAGRDVTALGGFTVLTLISGLAIALLLMLGRRLQAVIFAAAVLFAQGSAELVKHIVARPRPELVAHHDLVYSSSFPSGHSVMSPVVYLTLAAIIAAGSVRSAIKLTLLMGAAVLVVAIGVSRVYLGVHWPTDVLAGWTMGATIAWIAAVALHMSAPKRPGGGEVLPDAKGVT